MVRRRRRSTRPRFPTRLRLIRMPPLLGSPVANVSVFVVGGDGGLVPVGVPGELCIGGLGVARGYWGRPELTAERFVGLGGLVGGGGVVRVYRSGDRVVLRPDGLLRFLGRFDAQVKVRGHRVEPGEVEAVLAGHPQVRGVVVGGFTGGDGVGRLVAYVVADEGVRVGLEGRLRAFVRGCLPEVMVPSVVVVLDALPVTPGGKVDRRALPAVSVRGGAGDGVVGLPAGVGAGSGDVLGVLSGIWSRVLRIGQIGSHENFLDLGGDSLDLMAIRDQIRAQLGVRLPVADLFQSPTLRAQAETVVARLAVQGRGSVGVSAQPRRTAAVRVLCARPDCRHRAGLQFPGSGERRRALEAVARGRRDALASRGRPPRPPMARRHVVRCPSRGRSHTTTSSTPVSSESARARPP
jgi:aryl carrier-like protein